MTAPAGASDTPQLIEAITAVREYCIAWSRRAMMAVRVGVDDVSPTSIPWNFRTARGIFTIVFCHAAPMSGAQVFS
ncbi:hypothetical protein [Bradyrhizobium sp.]|uniref:hypothetical protein n=1 Tax=Bradyrhizobium sp. TaxID=376 RepID=UPI0039E4B79D